ncbi:hypothetical protein FQA39_LY03610 [Lamprigera yunnana]|nr:hypothetical protein FQA39_LY03610 [Lamprigera yunnana]
MLAFDRGELEFGNWSKLEKLVGDTKTEVWTQYFEKLIGEKKEKGQTNSTILEDLEEEQDVREIFFRSSFSLLFSIVSIILYATFNNDTGR